MDLTVFSAEGILIDTITEYVILNSVVSLDSIEHMTSLAIHENKLFVSDTRGSHIIHVVNLGNMTFEGTILKKGDGPGQYLYEWDMDVNSEGQLYFMDVKKKQLVIFDLNRERSSDSNRYWTADYLTDINLDFTPINLEHAGGVNYCLNQEGGMHRFYKADKSLTKIESAHGFLLSPMNKGMTEFDIAFMSEARASILDGLLFITYLHAPLIDIYTTEGTYIKSYFGPDQFDPLFRLVDDGTMYSTIANKSRNGYFDVKASDDYIYCLYDGKVEQYLFNDSGNSTLVILDKKGELKKMLLLPTGIFGFAVQKDSMLYGVRLSGESPEILQFELN